MIQFDIIFEGECMIMNQQYSNEGRFREDTPFSNSGGNIVIPPGRFDDSDHFYAGNVRQTRSSLSGSIIQDPNSGKNIMIPQGKLAAWESLGYGQLPDVKSSQKLIESFNLFQLEIPGNYENIYVPCCATDISPSISFSGSRVIYVDTDKKAINSILKNGGEAYCGNAITFKIPGDKEADVVVIFNPQIGGYQLTRNLKKDGYLLCNDYHGTATEFFSKIGEFELIGIIYNTDNGIILDKANPQEYWEEVDTDEDWKKFKFSWGGDIETYNNGKEFVERVLGRPSNNIIGDYKMIRNDIDKYMPIIIEKDIGDNYGGATIYYEPKNLPKKKGKCDDTFIFKKI